MPYGVALREAWRERAEDLQIVRIAVKSTDRKIGEIVLNLICRVITGGGISMISDTPKSVTLY